MEIRVRRILVPIDFSEHAQAVTDWAIHLGQVHGASLLLLHVYHLPVELEQVEMEGAFLPQDYWEGVREESARSLEKLAAPIRERGVSVETLVREGFPATVIEEEAAAQEADLIVIGSRGRSGIRHLLLGSIAERVVQHAPCPVLTVRVEKE